MWSMLALSSTQLSMHCTEYVSSARASATVLMHEILERFTCEFRSVESVGSCSHELCA